MKDQQQTPRAGEAAHTPYKLVRGAVNVGIEYDDGITPVRQIAWSRTDNPKQDQDMVFVWRACNAHEAHEELARKADALEHAANTLACARDKQERDTLTVKLATAQVEYREARAALQLAKEGRCSSVAASAISS